MYVYMYVCIVPLFVTVFPGKTLSGSLLLSPWSWLLSLSLLAALSLFLASCSAFFFLLTFGNKVDDNDDDNDNDDDDDAGINIFSLSLSFVALWTIDGDLPVSKKSIKS